MNQNSFSCFVLKRRTKEASIIILNSRSNSSCINSTFTVSISVCRSNHFTVSHGARRLRPRRTSLVAKRAGYLSPPRVMLLRLRPAHKVNLGREVGFVPGAKARSAHQSRGLASLVRVTWCFDSRRMAALVVLAAQRRVVGITCPKPAGRRCWVATAGDCTAIRWRHNVTSDDLSTGKWCNSAPGISCIAYLVTILGELGRSDVH